MPEIVIKLSDILKDRNMTQSELVALTGIRSEAISNLTRGKVERLSLNHLQKVMTALEISNVSELLEYVSDPTIEPIVESVEENPLDDPIEMLQLPAKIYFALKKNWGVKINSVSDLVNADLSRTRNIGPASLKLIHEALDDYLKRNR